MSLTCPGTRLRLIDDIGEKGASIPLFEIYLSDLLIEGSDWSMFTAHDTSKFFLQARLRISHYNEKMEVWEPTIEPWRFQLYHIHADSVDKFSLTSTERMELNLTTSLIATGVKVKGILSHPLVSGVPQEPPQQQQLQPFEGDNERKPVKASRVISKSNLFVNNRNPIVRNETGKNIYYLLNFNDTKKILEAEQYKQIDIFARMKMDERGKQEEEEAEQELRKKMEWHVLETGKEAVLPFSEEKIGGMKDSSSAKYILSIRIEGPFRQLDEIPIHTLGTFILDITPRSVGSSKTPSFERIDILYEVAFRKGCKIVTFK